MKVCLLNDSFPPVIDGVANTVMNYASVLTSMGDEVVVGTPRYPGADYTSYPYQVVPYDSVDTTMIVSGYRAGNPFDVKAVEQLSKTGPDIIHSHCPVASQLMARLLRNQVTSPVIFTYHTKFDYDIARAVKAKSLQEGAIRFLVNNISSCNEVWTVSKGAGENLKSLGFTGEYRVMNNGVDFARGRVSAQEVAAATAEYDLPSDLPVFLFVGRLMNYKGLPLILEALKILSGYGQDFRMVFIGNGADAEGLQQTARKLGFSVDIMDEKGSLQHTDGQVPGKIIFTGAIHDRAILRAWNTRADLFLFPSTYDTNGIVVREAAACGLASVLIRNSCAAEGITDGRNGFLIEETPESMAELLTRLDGNLDLMAQAGQHAMDEIYISWEDAVRTARERYQVVLEENARLDTPLRRQDPMDLLIEAAGNLQDLSEAFLDTSRSVSGELQANLLNAQENVRHTQDEMEKEVQRFQEDLKNAGEQALRRLQDLNQTILKNLEEYGQFLMEDDGSQNRN